MDMGDKQLTGQESLMIIQKMIESAKQEQRDDGRGWILWGWMLFAASVLTIINLHARWVQTFFFWNVFGILSVVLLILAVVKNVSRKRLKGAKTYTREVFDKLNIGFAVTLMLNIVAMNMNISPVIGFPLLTALYGFWILIYGALLNFRPSIIAAFITWALSLTAMFVPTFQWVMILHAAAVFVGYIVPGHLANREFNKVAGRQSTKSL